MRQGLQISLQKQNMFFLQTIVYHPTQEFHQPINIFVVGIGRLTLFNCI